jgi:hypothetical protein
MGVNGMCGRTVMGRGMGEGVKEDGGAERGESVGRGLVVVVKSN